MLGFVVFVGIAAALVYAFRAEIEAGVRSLIDSVRKGDDSDWGGN